MSAKLLGHGLVRSHVQLSGTPLHSACARAFTQVARRLLGAKADPNARDKQGFTPLRLALGVDSPDLVQALREAGASDAPPSGQDRVYLPLDLRPRNVTGPGRLLDAAARGNLPGVRRLLQGGVDLEARTEDGWTALHEAVVHGPELTRLLIDAGANVNASSEAGYTPLHRAAAKGQADVVKLLVQHGADVSATDVGGTTLLGFAKSSGNRETIEAVTAVCPSAPKPSAEGDPGRLFDFLIKSIERAPRRLAAATRAGHVLFSGGDGSSAERPVIVHAPEMGSGVVAIYEFLDQQFGPRDRKCSPGPATGSPECGWRFNTVSCQERNGRHLNCVELELPHGDRRELYFDVSEWAPLHATMLVLMAHARVTGPHGAEAK